MSNPRSSTFIQYQFNAPGNGPVFTMPASFTGIVKHALLYNFGPTAALVQVVVCSPAFGFCMPLTRQELAANGTEFDWEGQLVMRPGDQMYVASDAADVAVWVSGMVMEGVPPVQPGTTMIAQSPAILTPPV